MSTLNIQIPEGQEIDLDKSDLSKCLIVFKDKKIELPKTWRELKTVTGYYVSGDSLVCPVSDASAHVIRNRNIYPTKELAEASLALAQLLQLRDRYNGDWKPDFTDNSYKYVIEVYFGNVCTGDYKVVSRVLAFKDKNLRDMFLENFRDLIEIAKPLI